MTENCYLLEAGGTSIKSSKTALASLSQCFTLWTYPLRYGGADHDSLKVTHTCVMVWVNLYSSWNISSLGDACKNVGRLMNTALSRQMYDVRKMILATTVSSAYRVPYQLRSSMIETFVVILVNIAMILNIDVTFTDFQLLYCGHHSTTLAFLW